MRVVTVCTGNLCRSPLAAQVLRARLSGLPALRSGRLVIESAGTQARPGDPMPDPAARSSRSLGGNPDGHAARYLDESVLEGVSLVLALERAHRSRVVSLMPTLLRRTFTLREFARLTATVDDDTLFEQNSLFPGTDDPESRLVSALAVLTDLRGIHRADTPEDDDVIDPYQRSEATYALSASQMVPGIDAVVRLLSTPRLWQD